MDTSKLPKTRAEAMSKGAKYYFTGVPCKHGHIAPRKTKGSCVECLKDEWARGNVERAEYFKAYNGSDAGQAAKRRYYEANREQVIARAAARTPEEKRAAKKKHKVNNVETYKGYTSMRRRRHKDATPPWITPEQKLEMRKLYLLAMELTKTTGERYVVDHRVPLMHPEVCGLHVPWNLRVITRHDNAVKSNKLEE